MTVVTSVNPSAPTDVALPLASLESLAALVTVPEYRRPDETIPPRWFVTTSADAPDDDASGWTAGQWIGSYANGCIKALSPTFGDDADAAIQLPTRGVRNVFMMHTTVTGEKPVRLTHRLTST